jgi:hypothetical protein
MESRCLRRLQARAQRARFFSSTNRPKIGAQSGNPGPILKAREPRFSPTPPIPSGPPVGLRNQFRKIKKIRRQIFLSFPLSRSGCYRQL